MLSLRHYKFDLLTIYNLPLFNDIIIVPPSPPNIFAVSAVTAREGQEYQLSCISANGGNPEPNITWYRNNQLLTNTQGINKIHQIQHSNGTTISSLSWIPTLEDHQSVYKCLVTNRAMLGIHPYVTEHRLQVECKYFFFE